MEQNKPKLEELKEFVGELPPDITKSDTIVVTSIYQPFWGTEKFLLSCQRVGLPVVNAFRGHRFTGNGDVIRMIYEMLLRIKEEGKYSKVIYSDGADTIFIKPLKVPNNKVVYSVEKAVWPPTAYMHNAWNEYYSIKQLETPWKYLNGGGYCGPIDLLISFYEKGGLSTLRGNINGQGEQAIAYLNLVKDGFPVELDTDCKLFQTVAFEDPGDFQVTPETFKNLKTGAEPCNLHGNGRTDMTKLYEIYKL